MRRECVLSLTLLGTLAASMSCNESLPPYQDPRDVLRGVPKGEYILSYFENSFHVSFTIKNVYEETFQAEATFEGTLVITAKRDPKIQKTVHLSAANISYAANYNKSTRFLTLDPADSVVLSYTWDFIDDVGQDLRVMFFRYAPDTSCVGRYIASEETFLLQGSVKMYEKVPEVSAGPIEYTFCHINAYVSPHECLTPHREPPCGFR